MAATQTDAVSLLKAWFDKATNWQKDLFCQIIIEVNDSYPSEMFNVCPLSKELVKRFRVSPLMRHYIT